MKRVLLLLPATGYRNADFLAAAKKLGVEVKGAEMQQHFRDAAEKVKILLSSQETAEFRVNLRGQVLTTTMAASVVHKNG